MCPHRGFCAVSLCKDALVFIPAKPVYYGYSNQQNAPQKTAVLCDTGKGEFIMARVYNFSAGPSMLPEKVLKQAQADVQYAAATKALDKGDFDTFLNEFFKAIHSRYDIEKPVVQRLIRKKLNIINRLREENRSLKQATIEKEKSLVKYAREYIIMGDECLKLEMKEAAMKNYEKAVALCPKFKEAWKKIKKLEKEMLKR